MKYFCNLPKFLLLTLLLTTSVKPGSISGNVNNQATGQGIHGAEVIAIGFSPAVNDSITFRTTTQVSGDYQLTIPISGNYFIQVLKPGFQSSGGGPYAITDSIHLTGVNFSLVPQATINNLIEGTVYDSSTMNTVANATLHLFSPNGTVLSYSTHSDVNGSYSFQNVIPNIYKLGVSANQYRYYVHNSLLTVTANTQITDLNVYLSPIDSNLINAAISGTVTNQANGQGIQGAEIIAFGFSPAVNDSLIFRTFSQVGGNYELQIPVPGNYYVKAFKAGFQPGFAGPYMITDTTNLTGVNFALVGSSTVSNFVSGFVFDSLTLNPIANARVSLTTANLLNVTYTTYSGQNGAYDFHNLLTSVYRLDVTAQGYRPYQHNSLITIDSSTHIVDLNVYLSPVDSTASTVVTGFVYAINSDSTTIPLQNAKVTLAGNAGVIWTAFSQSNGEYVIDNVLPGMCKATCSATGYNQVMIPNYYVHPGINQLDFYLRSTINPTWGTITGNVFFDSINVPIDQAVIEIMSSNPAQNHITYTDQNGDYSINVPQGTYYVKCRYQYPNGNFMYSEYFDNVQILSQATPVPVSQGTITPNINFGIPPVGTGSHHIAIKGVVRDQSGNNPLPQAMVHVRVANPGIPDSIIYFTRVNANGEYQFNLYMPNNLPVFSFIVSAVAFEYHEEFWQEKPDIFLADILHAYSDTIFTNIDFTLEPFSPGTTYSISGNISDSVTGPINNGFIVGSNSLTGMLAFTFSDSLGNYSLTGLTAGVYFILFAADGHVPEFYDNALIWENATPISVFNNVTNIDALLQKITPTSNTGIISGSVVSNNGTALSGVLVTILNLDGTVAGYDFTDGNGNYAVSGFSTGVYTVTGTRVQYTSYVQNVNLNFSGSTVQVVNFNLMQSPTAVEDTKTTEIPESIVIYPNFPNPFNPTTTIRFSVPNEMFVKLSVYNVLGQQIAELLNERIKEGFHEATFDANKLTSGIYFYRLDAENYTTVRKMILQK